VVPRRVQTGLLRDLMQRLRPVAREIGRSRAGIVMLYPRVLQLGQRGRELRGVLAARTPDCDPAKDAGIIVGGLDGVHPSHRKSGNGAAVLLGESAVVLINKRNHLGHEALRIRTLVRCAHRSASTATCGGAATCCPRTSATSPRRRWTRA